MRKRSFWLGVLALLSLAGVLTTAGRTQAQTFTTASISTRYNITFFTIPAPYAPTYISADAFGGAYMGLTPVYRMPSAVRPAKRETLPAPKSTMLPADRAAKIELRLPADAAVWIEGQRMKQTGSVRQFVSPPLAADQTYHYDVRVAWRENGRDIATTRHLSVRAGQHESLLILRGSDAGNKTLVKK